MPRPRRLALGLVLAGVLVMHGWALQGLSAAPRSASAAGLALAVRHLEMPAALPIPAADLPPATERPAPRAAAGGPVVSPRLRVSPRPAPAVPSPGAQAAGAEPVAVAEVAAPAQTPVTPEPAVADAERIAVEAGRVRLAALAGDATPAAAGAAPAPPPARVPAVPAPAVRPGSDLLADMSAPNMPASDRPVSDRSAAEAGPAVPPPAYATRVAAPFSLRYRMRRGLLSGEARLDWRHDGRQYQARLEAGVVPLGTVLAQSSSGTFDAAGVAPQRFTERRWRRGERAVNFVRRGVGHVPRITFSAQAGEAPGVSGVQDRLSWMVQLAAIAAGWSGAGPGVGDSITLHVAGPAGDVQQWVFHVAEAPAAGGGALRLERRPDDAYGTAVQVWLDPSRHFLPRQVQLTEARGDPLELTRIEAPESP